MIGLFNESIEIYVKQKKQEFLINLNDAKNKNTLRSCI